mmetsp:Transcript_483/g.1070  ORF Transcript_483/g.1070 Transcript_483/m.1070 type:complete len:287 (-) Transcript_483:1458-2318(-)
MVSNPEIERSARLLVSIGPVFNLEFVRSFNLGFRVSDLFSSKDDPIDVQRMPSTRCFSIKVEECTSFTKSGTLTAYFPSSSGDWVDNVNIVRKSCILTTSFAAFDDASFTFLVVVYIDNISRNNPESDIAFASALERIALRLPPPSNKGWKSNLACRFVKYSIIGIMQTAVRIHGLLSDVDSSPPSSNPWFAVPLFTKTDFRGRTHSTIRARESSDDRMAFFISSRGQTLHTEVPHIRPDEALIISLEEQIVARDDNPTAAAGDKVFSGVDFPSGEDRMDITSWSE